jgi:hypothetical protein
MARFTHSITEFVKTEDQNENSGIPTFLVAGFISDLEDPSSEPLPFIAGNNVDKRYPERFKVNWNGRDPRMPETTCTGLILGRGHRISIARLCKQMVWE